MRITGTPFASSTNTTAGASLAGLADGLQYSNNVLGSFWQSNDVAKDANPFCAIRFAAQSKFKMVCVFLESWGANINIGTFSGTNPTSIAGFTSVRSIAFGDTDDNGEPVELNKMLTFYVLETEADGVGIWSSGGEQPDFLKVWEIYVGDGIPDNKFLTYYGWSAQTWTAASYDDTLDIHYAAIPGAEFVLLGEGAHLAGYRANCTNCQVSTYYYSYRNRFSQRFLHFKAVRHTRLRFALSPYKLSSYSYNDQTSINNAMANTVTYTVHANNLALISEASYTERPSLQLISTIKTQAVSTILQLARSPSNGEPADATIGWTGPPRSSATITVFTKDDVVGTTIVGTQAARVTLNKNINNGVDGSVTPIQTTQLARATLNKNINNGVDGSVTPIQTTQTPQALLVKDNKNGYTVTPIQTTQTPQAILTKDLGIPNVRVATLYAQIAYSYDNIPIRTTVIPQALLLEDSTITPIRVTQSAQGLLVKQGPTDRRFTQVVSALLVKEDPTEFFLNFRPLILPDMKTLYTSSKARAFMVGDTDYIQLEGYLPEGSHLLRNGVNVGRTTPVANGDTFEVVSGVMNYFTTSILIYRYEWTGDQTIRELVGLWPVTQPVLSPVPRWANNRNRTNKQNFVSDYVRYVAHSLQAVWHEVNTAQPELVPVRHKFNYAENKLGSDVTAAKVFTIQSAGLVALSAEAAVYKLDKSNYVKVGIKTTITDRKSYVSAGARVNNILNSGYLISRYNIQKGSNDFVSNHIRQFVADAVHYKRGVKGAERVVYDQFDMYYVGAEIATVVSYEKVDSRLTKVQIDYIDRISNAETFGVEQTAMHAVVRKSDQRYEKSDSTRTFIRQFFVKFQFFPKDAEGGVVSVYYDAVVGNSIFSESKYQRNGVHTQEISRAQFSDHAAIHKVDQSFLFGRQNVYSVESWYSNYEYRPQLIKSLYTDRKEKVITISSSVAIVPANRGDFYYSAGMYGGFDTLQQMQTFTEYFDGVKAISTYNGYRYTTSVDQTFACELFSNGPVKWLLQGG